METAVTVRQGTGVYIPSRIGGQELVWQEPVSVVTTHTGARIRIEGTRSEMLTSHGSSNVSEDVPAVIADDHEAIVRFWEATVKGWTASAAHRSADDVFVIDGMVVEAPGFTSGAQFTAFVARAKTAGLNTWSARPGVVLVSSSRDNGRFRVTRTSCTCQGHASHGRCKHRALALWLVNVEGVNLCRVATMGAGVTILPGPAAAAAEVA